MSEPTRYDCHEPMLNLDKLPQGRFVAYTDYAKLRNATKQLLVLLRGDEKQIGILDTTDGYYQWSIVAAPLLAELDTILGGQDA